jgi:hypothetical protein
VRIGITGHSNLAPEAVPVVTAAVTNVLAEAGEAFVGVSCLARGADQVFARAVLALGGQLEVILPAADYRDRKVKPDNASEFDDLISRATSVRTVPFDQSGRDAYLAASEAVLVTVDRLVAVWDGKPADGHGGTGDVVAAAHDRNLPVTVVWPEGAARV